jgi:hypothetical protein
MSSAVGRAGSRGVQGRRSQAAEGKPSASRRGGSRRSVRHQSPGSLRTGSGWEPRDRRVVGLLDAPEQAAAAICRGCPASCGLPCSCVGGTGAPRGLGWALGERTRGHPDRVSERSGRRLVVLPGGLRRRSLQPHSCPLRPAGGVVGGGRHGGQKGQPAASAAASSSWAQVAHQPTRPAGSTTGSAGARWGFSGSAPVSRRTASRASAWAGRPSVWGS